MLVYVEVVLAVDVLFELLDSETVEVLGSPCVGPCWFVEQLLLQ